MNRRGFLQTSFAGIALSTGWFGFKTRKQIDLKPFCQDYESYRYDLQTPFAQGGQAIATNSRILIRTSLADLPELSDERRLPDISRLPFWNQTIDRWHRWPAQKYVGDCNIEHDCPECIGKGGWGNVRDCTKCEGEGFDDYLCGACQGTGYTRTAGIQPLGGILIASAYDKRLRDLQSDLEFAIVGDGDCIRFRGDGFDGLLMAINPN